MATTKAHRSLLPILVWVATSVIGVAIAYIGGTQLHQSADAHTERGALGFVLLGAAIGVGGIIAALLWYTCRLPGLDPTGHVGAIVLFGILSGTLALVVATLLESIHIAGWLGTTQGSGFYAAFVEEAAKLLLPVILLVFVRRFRDPLTGFWVAVVGAAWFGVIEGAFYVAGAAVDVIKSGPGSAGSYEPIVIGLDVLVRSWADIGHPLTTGGAIVVILIAAARLPRARAVLAGVGAYLVAALLHALDDGVIGYYITNDLIAGFVILALMAVTFFVWYRPQAKRLSAVVTAAPVDVDAGAEPAS